MLQFSSECPPVFLELQQKQEDDKERVGGRVSGGGRIEAGGEWFCSKDRGDAEKEPGFSDKEVITECFVIDQQEH